MKEITGSEIFGDQRPPNLWDHALYEGAHFVPLLCPSGTLRVIASKDINTTKFIHDLKISVLFDKTLKCQLSVYKKPENGKISE